MNATPLVRNVGGSFDVRLIHLFAFIALLVVVVGGVRAQEPNISERFPIRERSNISPPIVEPAIHECAMAVSISGFLPKATVRVFANGSELIGTDKPKHSPAKIKLTRALVLGDKITATQTVGSVSSDQSYDFVVVTDYPALTTPVVVPDIYQCGQVVPVANLIASTHVEVSDFKPTPLLVGTDETTGDRDPVVTSPLVDHHPIRARQLSCPNIPAKTAKSALSAALTVKTAPNPPPTVKVDVPVVGNDQLVLHNLLVGSAIEFHYGPTAVPDGLATAADNVADVPPVPPSTQITASQKLCSPSIPSAPVVASDKPDTPILGGPICPGSRYAMVDNTTPGLNVVLLRGGSVIGYGGGSMGTLKLAVGAGVSLSEGDVLTVIQYMSSSFGTFFSSASNAVMVGCAGGANVVTQHNDNHRTGAYTAETILTPNAVLARGMRVKWTHPVKGWINTQPLYVRHVEFARGRDTNGLFIGTVFTNTLYALNADNGNEMWSKTLVDSDTNKRGLAQGIDSTPVIDVATHRIYIAFSTKNQDLDAADQPDSRKPLNDKDTDGNPKVHHYQDTDLKNLDTAFWIVALDYRDGHEVARTRVDASMYRANGKKVTFEASFHRQHPALLLDHGVLYVAFGSIAGSEGFLEYHGWVAAYRAHDLAFQSAFNTSKNYAPSRAPYQFQNSDDASGIWQGGGGLAADRDGNVFFLVGNGTADIAHDKYGDTFVKLVPTGSSLVPTAFVPPDAVAMAANDADFGAGGALTIPGTDLVIGGGKPGFMYLLDRNTMLLREQFVATTNQYDSARRDDTWNKGPHLHGSPTYWRGPESRFGNLYVWGEKDFLRRYRVDIASGLVVSTADHGAVLALEDWHAMPGGMISLSSDQNRAGTGIVWAALPTSSVVPHPARLYAFNAETLQPLWDTAFPSMGHWLPPTIADGKVFLGTSSDMVICYELDSEKGHGNNSWNPYQPKQTSMAMKQPSAKRWNESPMTMLPLNTLAQLTPPPDVSMFANLDAEGASSFAAQGVPSGRNYVWSDRGSALEATITIVGRPQAEERRLNLTIAPDGTWNASDGSSADLRLIKSYASPTDDGIAWALYKVERSSASGILSDVEYIQRVATHGGTAPSKAPKSESDVVRTAIGARYILFKRQRP